VTLGEILYDPGENRVRGFLLGTGERIEADIYVAALPAWAFAPLIPGPLRPDPFFAGIAALPVAPAISVQVWFDRHVVSTPDYTLVARSAVPVYQDQAAHTYPYAGGSRISATIAPADEYLSWTEAALVALTLEALAKVQPEVREARVVKSVVLKHAQHLIRRCRARCRPGRRRRLRCPTCSWPATGRSRTTSGARRGPCGGGGPAPRR
jgi:15-cis-phytoene desaturase